MERLAQDETGAIPGASSTVRADSSARIGSRSSVVVGERLSFVHPRARPDETGSIGMYGAGSGAAAAAAAARGECAVDEWDEELSESVTTTVGADRRFLAARLNFLKYFCAWLLHCVVVREPTAAATFGQRRRDGSTETMSSYASMKSRCSSSVQRPSFFRADGLARPVPLPPRVISESTFAQNRLFAQNRRGQNSRGGWGAAGAPGGVL